MKKFFSGFMLVALLFSACNKDGSPANGDEVFDANLKGYAKLNPNTDKGDSGYGLEDAIAFEWNAITASTFAQGKTPPFNNWEKPIGDGVYVYRTKEADAGFYNVVMNGGGAALQAKYNDKKQDFGNGNDPVYIWFDKDEIDALELVTNEKDDCSPSLTVLVRFRSSNNVAFKFFILDAAAWCAENGPISLDFKWTKYAESLVGGYTTENDLGEITQVRIEDPTYCKKKDPFKLCFENSDGDPVCPDDPFEDCLFLSAEDIFDYYESITGETLDVNKQYKWVIVSEDPDLDGTYFEGGEICDNIILKPELVCNTYTVEFTDEYGQTKTETYNDCEEPCFGKWVNHNDEKYGHTALIFGWTKQLCPFLQWEYNDNKVENDDCDIFDPNGTNGNIVLKARYNCPIVNATYCDDFMKFLFNATDVTKLFPEKCSVFSDNTLYTNYYATPVNGSRNLTYTAKPIVQQLFSLPDRTTAKNATLNYIEITKDNTELYLTYIHEGAGWLNALGYFVIPASVANNDAAEYAYYNTEIKPNMTSAGNVLKQEYMIFDYIADKNPVNQKPSVTAYQERGQVTRIGGANKTFNIGDRVVLFMCPNSYNPTTKQVEVTFNPRAAGNVKQIFFMHKYFNTQTGIKFNPALLDFAGCQMMTFYAASCESMVFCVEDIHGVDQYADLDFNDIIFTITDNVEGKAASSFTPPKWAIGENINDGTELEILTTDCLLYNKCD